MKIFGKCDEIMLDLPAPSENNSVVCLKRLGVALQTLSPMSSMAVFKEFLELHNPFSSSHPLHDKLFPTG